jgi:hypothetical protein
MQQILVPAAAVIQGHKPYKLMIWCKGIVGLLPYDLDKNY